MSGRKREEAPCGILEFIELKLFVSLAAMFRNGNVAARAQHACHGVPPGLDFSYRFAPAHVFRAIPPSSKLWPPGAAQSDFHK
jgi:hypothetical protein